MTVTIHKVSAAEGYRYYLRCVAAHDATQRGRSPLVDYYAEKGESPGTWMGSGLSAFEVVGAGDAVTEEQMEALFGEGKRPDAAQVEAAIVAEKLAKGATRKQAQRAAEAMTRLGRRYGNYRGMTEFRKKCSEAFSEFNKGRGSPADAAVPDEERSRIRTEMAREMFAEEFGRVPVDSRELSGWVARNSRGPVAVGGIELCASPPKSVSALWAVAPAPLAGKIAAAHAAAVADAVALVEQRFAYTRAGRDGVRQLEVDGLIVAAFTHRQSRAGDPDLHTHLLIANRARASDGQWRALDGRMLYRGTVLISEFYNTQLELHLRALAGLEMADVAHKDPDKRPVREIVAVDPRLSRAFSKRRKAIEARLVELAMGFQQAHGREPIPVELVKLAQQATLETRPDKHKPSSFAQQRGSWWTEAVEVLGSGEAVAAMVFAACHPRSTVRDPVDAAWVERTAELVVATVAQRRAVWRRTHLEAETLRRIRAHVELGDRARVACNVTDAAVGLSVPLRAPDRMDEPSVLRRADGVSMYEVADSTLFTSPEMLAAEQRIVAAAQRPGGRVLSPEAVDIALLEFAANRRGMTLNAGQTGLVREFAGCGRSFAVAVAPAGTGKTTAMQVLTRAWQSEGGTVIGLAPNANAAAVLGAETGAGVFTTIDKLTWTLAQLDAGRPVAVPDWIHAIGPDTLIIVDEIAQAATLKLDRLLTFCLDRGASVRGIGDDRQLASPAAGGVIRDVINAAGAATLSHIVRFSDPAEGPASLAVRAGDPAGLGFYIDAGRIHVGTPDTVTADAYTAWARDRDAGFDAIMLAPTHDIVNTLNQRARADRLAADPAREREANLADGLRASVGDTVRTSRNAPWLPISQTDHVRNGYRWRVCAVHPDGALELTHLASHRRCLLPARYVAAHVTLGYAATVDSAQGITADICHGIVTDRLTRNRLYVLLTRGRHENHAWVPTALDNTEQAPWSHAALQPHTGVEYLTTVLAHDDADHSATTTTRLTHEPRRRLAHAARAYTDAITVIAEHQAGPDTLAHIHTSADALHPGLPDEPAWPVLRAHLAIIALTGRDPLTALRAAIAERELDTADDAAAVLDWRLDHTGSHSSGPGPLPWLPGIPAPLAQHKTYGPYLTARRDLITDLADQVTAEARDWTPATAPLWARTIVEHPSLTTELAVWRAALGIDDADIRPTGPPVERPNAERRHQHHLNDIIDRAISHTHDNTNRWTSLARSIEPRLIRDPYWPILSEHLDLTDRAGIDVPTALRSAAALRPLPDEMPAAVLWWRLAADLEPGALDNAQPAAPPTWIGTLNGQLGPDTAKRLLAAPAWNRVLAATDKADPAQWNPAELIGTAYSLLTDTQDDSDRLRPDQLATALAWRITAILRNTTPLGLPPEPPDPEDDECAATLAGLPDHHAGHAEAPQEPPDTTLDDWPAPPQPASVPYPEFDAEQRVRQLVTDVGTLQDQIHDLEHGIANDTSPFRLLADPYLARLRARAEHQRPYQIAAMEAHGLWMEAEHHAEDDRRNHDTLAEDLARNPADPTIAELRELAEQITDPAMHAQLTELIADEPIDIGRSLELYTLTLAAEHSAARAARTHADYQAAHAAWVNAADSGELLSHDDVLDAALSATMLDIDDLNKARTRLATARSQLSRAEQHLAALRARDRLNQLLVPPTVPADPLFWLTDAQLRQHIDTLQQRNSLQDATGSITFRWASGTISSIDEPTQSTPTADDSANRSQIQQVLSAADTDRHAPADAEAEIAAARGEQQRRQNLTYREQHAEQQLRQTRTEQPHAPETVPTSIEPGTSSETAIDTGP